MAGGEKVLWIGVATKGKFRVKRNPREQIAMITERMPVTVRVVDAAAAPVAYRLRTAGTEWTWRVVDGVLMREFCGKDGKPLASVEDVERLFASPMDLVRHHWRFSWRDNPLATDMRADRELQILQEDQIADRLRAQPYFLRFTDYAPEEVLGRARETAAGFAVVDGRLYRPAAPPVWSVWVDIWNLRAGRTWVIPSIPEIDVEGRSNQVAFGPRERGQAEAFADRMREALPAMEWLQPEGAHAVRHRADPEIGELEDFGIDETPIDGAPMLIDACLNDVRHNLKDVKFEHLDSDLLAGWCEARDGLAEGGERGLGKAFAGLARCQRAAIPTFHFVARDLVVAGEYGDALEHGLDHDDEASMAGMTP